MSYQLKSVKNTVGREGVGFTANLYLDNAKIAYVSDYGDGGGVRVDYLSREIREVQEPALAFWHRENCIGHYSRALTSNSEQAMNLLYFFYDKDKESKKSIAFEVGPDISLMTDVEATEYFESTSHFEEHADLVLKSQGFTREELLTEILLQYPTARIWNPQTHRAQAVSELISV